MSAKGIGWREGKKEDFDDLHQAIKDGKTKNNKYSANKDPNNSSDSSSEDDIEPSEGQPGRRFLWACQHNKIEVVETLLNSDPKLILFRDDDGYTGLHRASYSNHPQIALALLRAGADITARTEDELWQPIHSACRWNAAETLEVLLSWGADVNATTNGGQTPLHLAAFCGSSRKSLQLLLVHPKLKSITKNVQGDTPKDIAMRNGNCVDLFDLVQPAYKEVTSYEN